MITLLVLEDETKIYRLISQVLGNQGYSFIDEPQSGGLIKIIKKANQQQNSIKSCTILDLNMLFLEEDNWKLYRGAVRRIERSLIASVLERTDGNQLKAARILGINRNTLRTKIKKLGIVANR